MKSTGSLAMAVGFIVAGYLVLAAGCSQTQHCDGTCSAPKSSNAGMAHSTHEGGGTQAAAVSQKTCPVSGEPIDPAVATDYKGTKVYFCCADCIEKFNKEPEKYMAKLK